jgi:DNA-binding Lrp family transcriptional regulator
VKEKMASAYILINCEIGEESSVMSQLKEMPNVSEVHIVYGVYDLIAKIEAEDTDSLKKIVTENLRVLEKVRSTMTMICVDQ